MHRAALERRRSSRPAAQPSGPLSRIEGPRSPERASSRTYLDAEAAVRLAQPNCPASFRLGGFKCERIAQQAIRVANFQPVRRRAIKTARQADRTGRAIFLARGDKTLRLHAAKRHVNGSAFETPSRRVDELEAVTLRGFEQIEHERLGGGNRWKALFCQEVAILHFVRLMSSRQQYT